MKAKDQAKANAKERQVKQGKSNKMQGKLIFRQGKRKDEGRIKRKLKAR